MSASASSRGLQQDTGQASSQGRGRGRGRGRGVARETDITKPTALELHASQQAELFRKPKKTFVPNQRKSAIPPRVEVVDAPPTVASTPVIGSQQHYLVPPAAGSTNGRHRRRLAHSKRTVSGHSAHATNAALRALANTKSPRNSMASVPWRPPSLPPRDQDDSDLEDEEGREAYLLDNIGLEDEMAPMNLPKDPKLVREREARKKERMILRLKEEEKKRKREEKDKAEADGKPFAGGEPNEDSESVYMSSHQGTPAPSESAAETLKSEDASDDEPGSEEEKAFKFEDKDNIAADFDIKENREQDRMYMFQFPRTFPHLVREEDAAALRPQYSADGTEIKPEPVKGAVPRGGKNPKNLVPPPWGTAGPRENMAARWPTAEGQMGELCIHKSGKVTMKIFGDLDFDVLPAAQATFLQEIAILDHDPALIPLQSDQTEADRPPSNPDRKLKIMGQTYKKFIVAPEVSHLLEKIAEQEKEEAELAAKRRLLKKEKVDAELAAGSSHL